MYGFVYVLRNESMPNLYKIGHTFKSPLQRAADLSSQTNMPKSFEVIFYGELKHPNRLENDLHERYKECRVNSSREFFTLSDDDLFWLCHSIKEVSENISYSDFYKILENKIVKGAQKWLNVECLLKLSLTVTLS